MPYNAWNDCHHCLVRSTFSTFSNGGGKTGTTLLRERTCRTPAGSMSSLDTPLLHSYDAKHFTHFSNIDAGPSTLDVQPNCRLRSVIVASCSVLDLGLASLDRHTRTVVPSLLLPRAKKGKNTTPPPTPTRSPPRHIAGAGLFAPRSGHGRHYYIIYRCLSARFRSAVQPATPHICLRT